MERNFRAKIPNSRSHRITFLLKKFTMINFPCALGPFSLISVFIRGFMDPSFFSLKEDTLIGCSFVFFPFSRFIDFAWWRLSVGLHFCYFQTPRRVILKIFPISILIFLNWIKTHLNKFIKVGRVAPNKWRIFQNKCSACKSEKWKKGFWSFISSW